MAIMISFSIYGFSSFHNDISMYPSHSPWLVFVRSICPVYTVNILEGLLLLFVDWALKNHLISLYVLSLFFLLLKNFKFIVSNVYTLASDKCILNIPWAHIEVMSGAVYYIYITLAECVKALSPFINIVQMSHINNWIGSKLISNYFNWVKLNVFTKVAGIKRTFYELFICVVIWPTTDCVWVLQ